jgi:hypothetical protein
MTHLHYRCVVAWRVVAWRVVAWRVVAWRVVVLVMHRTQSQSRTLMVYVVAWNIFWLRTVAHQMLDLTF